MAITTNAICDSFKKELLQGSHDFDASTDTYKLAMYTSSATLGKSTENYSTNPGGGSNTEVTSSGYTAGGGTLVNQGVKVSSSVAITDFADLSFVGVTLTARGALIYNDTNGDKGVAVLDFGGDKTATAGTFTIQFPAFTTSAAILRIA